MAVSGEPALAARRSPWLPDGELVVGGGVTTPEPFQAAGLHAGIKRSRPDLAILYSPAPCSAAACLTTNRVQAAPVVVTRDHLVRSGGVAQAVVVNSGVANACTGQRGLADARAVAAEAAGALGIPTERVLVASTGVIGVPLPVDRLRPAIRQACARLSREGGADAAEAILTTDTRPKQVAVAIPLDSGSRVVHIGGMAKGSGMIHPHMATMLAFITTDAAVRPEHLQAILRRAVERSFNMITVDGDTSTNDMVVLLASGARGPWLEPGTSPFERFAAGVLAVSTYLAKEIARDGEGATRLVEVQVTGAASEGEAQQVARTVASSNLVKTAVAGADPNWGRIAAAVGRSGADVDPARLCIWMGPVQVVQGGEPLPYDEARAREALALPEVTLRVDLGRGEASATAWTCDLTCDYVRINASYRS